MTFKETEFPALIRFMKSFIHQEANPFLVKDVMLQLIKMYESVPLYPGIVNMCISQVKKPVEPTELEPGQRVFLKNGDDYYVGTVTKKTEDEIKMKNVHALTFEDEYEFELEDMEDVQMVKDNVLEEVWPSLVFDKDKKR